MFEDHLTVTMNALWMKLAGLLFLADGFSLQDSEGSLYNIYAVSENIIALGCDHQGRPMTMDATYLSFAPSGEIAVAVVVGSPGHGHGSTLCSPTAPWGGYLQHCLVCWKHLASLF